MWPSSPLLWTRCLSGFLFNARAKAADLQTEVQRQRLADLRDNISRDVRNSWQDTNRAYQRMSVTQQLCEQASLALDLAQARYNLGLGSIVEFSQAELQKTEADIADTCPVPIPLDRTCPRLYHSRAKVSPSPAQKDKGRSLETQNDESLAPAAVGFPAHQF
jgi:hypothetical protein